MVAVFLRRSRVLSQLVCVCGRRRANSVVGRIERYLAPGERILELGSGSCHVANLLLKRGYRVTLMDVKEQSFVPGLRPLLYDGVSVPLADDTFDTATVLDVLHHANYPEQVLMEAKRVAKRVIVMESIYYCLLQRVLTVVMDMVINQEFASHPRNHRTDSEWRRLFRRNDLRVLDVEIARFWGVFHVATYLLEK